MPTPELMQDARKFVFDHFREQGVPPILEQFMERSHLSRAEAFEILQALEAAHHLKLVPGTQRILMAFPFSAIATPFRVHADGKTYYANCAWDSVAFHAMLDAPTRIESRCHHCASAVTVELAGGRMTRATPSEPLVYLALPAAKWWEDIVNTCSNHMVFFLSREHLAAWEVANPNAKGEALTVEQTHRLGFPIYKDKMKLEYARPSKDALVAHFASLGLTDDFWRL